MGSVTREGPRVVGRYAIHGEIASGGMAAVHFARLTGTAGARTVAVKRAHPHLAREKEFALMFLDEGRTAMRVRHPNVVSTLDVLRTGDDLVLVMDYVHGESLWNLVRAAKEIDERVPVPIVAAILIDTLHGLQAAHEATDEHGAPLGIVHRDVSPQNILVGADGVTRLVDFGIAKAAGRLHSTHDSSVKGKYAYMAPEQVRGEHVSAVTDTYAASIVLWELLTGERLFVGKTEAETIHKCLVGRVQAPSLVAPSQGTTFDALLKKGLSRDPAARYATARAMASDLEACVAAAVPAEVAAWVTRIAGDALAARARTIAEIERSESRVRGRSRRGAIALALVLTTIPAALIAVQIAKRREPTLSPREVAIAIALDAAPPTPAAVPSAPEAPSAAPPDAAPKATSPITRPPSRATPPRSRHPKRAACDPPYSIDSDGKQIFKPECM